MCLHQERAITKTNKSHMNLHDFFVDLLFYVHGKHLRSCRDGQLT